MMPIFLLLAFLLELVAFFAFSALPFVFNLNMPARIALSVLLFVALIAFWSLYMAPRASMKFDPVPYYVAKLCIYSVSAFVLFRIFGGQACGAFILACLIDEAALYNHNLAR